MRFLYATAILAALTASVQGYSTGSPVCKSDDATLAKIAAAGKMGKQVDASNFDDTWSFMLMDENSKPATGSIMTNMQYTVMVNGGPYNGVFTYPMFDNARMKVSDEAKAFSLEPAGSNFMVAKCAGTDGATITHNTADSKDNKVMVAKIMLMDGGNSKKFMMSGVVVTGKSTFGKVVSPTFDIAQGTGGGNNSTDGGNTGGNGGNGDNTGNGGGTTGNDGGNTDTGSGSGNTTDTTGTNSASFLRPAIALQLIALAAFLLA